MLNRDRPDGGRIAERLRGFADHAAGQSPLYVRLAASSADDPVAIDVLGSAPYGQPPANLLFAAVQYLLLEGRPSELATHYPTVSGPETEPVGDAVELFHGFLAEHRTEIEQLVGTRRVQTNEVRRCATLLPAFSTAVEAGRTLAIIEVGASAGLNLVFDRYAYEYGAVRVGGPSGLTLACEVRAGSPPIPERLPTVVNRLGLDLDPIDITDPESLRWAHALIWPEQVERVSRLEAAVAIARADPPPIRRGDALDLLPNAVAEAPDDAALVVYHSFVLNQWTPEDRERLDALLRTASLGRRIDRVSIEMLQRGQEFPDIHHTRYERRESVTRYLGRAHHHGAWVEWVS